MQRKSYYVINAITIYRIAAAPVLVFLIFTGNLDVFKWLLGVSFFTDLIDGALARKFKVSSILGAKLDSIGDDLTILAAIIGAFVFKLEFLKSQGWIIAVLLGLFIIQIVFSLFRYRKISSFHTYLAKIAAVVQGTFLILLFLLPEPVYFLFYTAAIITCLDLIEEIILVFILPVWEVNVKGLYWVLRRPKAGSNKDHPTN